MEQAHLEQPHTEHPFLEDEGVWTALGRYTDEQGQTRPASGRSRMIHGAGVWFLHSTLTVDNPTGAREFSNRYEIIPLSTAREHTRWTCHNPSLGHLRGEYSLVGDTIFSTFVDESARVRGVEFFLLLPDTGYVNRGTLLVGGKPAASWQMTLRPWQDPLRRRFHPTVHNNLLHNDP